MKKQTRKIGPIQVWIVGHTQNSLISETGAEGDPVRPLAVFYKRREAEAWCKANESIRKVYRARVVRDGSRDESKDMQIRELQHRLSQAQNEIAGMRAADETNAQTMAENERLNAELAALQKKIHHGKIWNTENPRWTPRTQAALGLAAKEAMAQGQTYVGTEHVLLGLLKQNEGMAARHFLACGMSYDRAEYAMRVSRHS